MQPLRYSLRLPGPLLSLCLMLGPCLMLGLCLIATSAHAETKKADSKKPAPAKHAATATGPKAVGTFDDWTAATHPESGQTVCYAFTRAQSSLPAIKDRGGVVLTVTERSTGRDAVAIEAGFSYAPTATVTVQVDQTGLEFYTNGRNAFARDGKAAVKAFSGGSRAIARSPGPQNGTVTDTFSLKGFSAAYAAIVKACPNK
jgi:hypothetical protein